MMVVPITMMPRMQNTTMTAALLKCVRNQIREMFVDEGRKSVVTYIVVSDPSEAAVTTTTTILKMNLRA